MERPDHVLVVDDDAEIRKLLGEYLQRNGFRVSLATDGREMRRALEQARPDIVVLDVMLPGDSGLSLCRDLRAGPGLPVIMLTARAEEIDRILGLEMGADDYMPKPFNPKELVARVKAVLQSGPRAVADAKALIREVGYRRVEDVQRYTVERLADIRATPEAQEGMRAFLEKRKPSWAE